MAQSGEPDYEVTLSPGKISRTVVRETMLRVGEQLKTSLNESETLVTMHRQDLALVYWIAGLFLNSDTSCGTTR